MRSLNNIYHFIGSVWMALILIFCAALFVAVGTYLEAHYQSHRMAAHYTYDNPLFLALLWGFFFNILVSALRRWPFKPKHVPFLITHLGLLLIFGGTLVKSYYGTQGSLFLLEGAGSHQLFLPDTYAVQVRSATERDEYRLSHALKLSTEAKRFPKLDIQLVGYAPHSQAFYESWVKGGWVTIVGVRPFPIQRELEAELAPASHAKGWDFYAFKIDPSEEWVQKFAQLKKPALVIADQEDETHLYAFHSDGTVQHETYSKSEPSQIAVYDRGYGGYCNYINLNNITLEAPLVCRVAPQQPLSKLEDNIPVITLRVKEEGHTEYLSLPYASHGQGLLWPVLQGRYLLRFQPAIQKLPYHVRLHRAIQRNYVQTNKPFSYESEITLRDLRTGVEERELLSMNAVHESWEGMRFYLAGIHPNDAGSVKKVHIIVNHDPAKYLMTYPGALLVTLGIFLLFWLKPYKTKT